MDTIPKFIKEIKLIPLAHLDHKDIVHHFLFAMFYTMGSNDFSRFMQEMGHPGRSYIISQFRKFRAYGSSVKLFHYDYVLNTPGPDSIDWSLVKQTMLGDSRIDTFIRTFADAFDLTTIINKAEYITRYGTNDIFSVIAQISHAMNTDLNNKLFKIEVEFV
jgi:hypothetical protein